MSEFYSKIYYKMRHHWWYWICPPSTSSIIFIHHASQYVSRAGTCMERFGSNFSSSATSLLRFPYIIWYLILGIVMFSKFWYFFLFNTKLFQKFLECTFINFQFCPYKYTKVFFFSSVVFSIVTGIAIAMSGEDGLPLLR